MLICVAGYAALILGAAQLVNPAGAQGGLVFAADGHVVGSAHIAQNFTAPRYFWPRPSAVDYAADAAGGSNKSPTSPALTERGREIVARYGPSLVDDRGHLQRRVLRDIVFADDEDVVDTGWKVDEGLALLPLIASIDENPGDPYE